MSSLEEVMKVFARGSQNRFVLSECCCYSVHVDGREVKHCLPCNVMWFVYRATASTNLNEHSSRSHSLLMVTVSTCTNGGPPSKGKLSLVDLAGRRRRRLRYIQT